MEWREAVSGLAGLPFVPTFGHVGSTLKQLAPQIAAQYVHIVMEAMANAASQAKTELILMDPRLVIEGDVAQEATARAAAQPTLDGTPQEVDQVWGSLGDIEFSLLTAPSAMSVQDGVVYARHALVGSTPRLQYTGRELQEISLDLAWHSMAHPDIEAQLEALFTAMHERTVLDLVIGQQSSAIYVGDYVIQRIPHKVQRHNSDGSIGAVELTVELLEWQDDPDLVLSKSAAAIKKTGAAPTPNQGSKARVPRSK